MSFELRPQVKAASRRKDKSRTSNSPSDHQSIFEGDHVWLNVPSQLTFVHIEDPYSQESPVLVHDDTLDTAGDEQNQPLSHECSPSPVRHSITEPHDELPVDSSSPPDISGYSSPHDVEPAESSIDPTIIALHLVRHFKEGPGQWMDLFDTGCYFSSKVPVIAATRPLLKSAACALAAKHLHHIHSDFSQPHFNVGRLNRGPVLAGHNIDWHYQSATYYDQAIGYLKDAVNLQRFDEDATEKEEIFAAVAILCFYELMNAPGTAWRAHLSALPLFSPDAELMTAPSSPVIIPRTAIKGPIFWSLARQDLLCAFISETQTRLDLKDMRLWQNAGLAADEDGVLQPFSPPNSADVRPSADVEEDTKSNELTWLLGKIANFLTSGDALYPEDYALPPGQRPVIGVTQEQLLERWSLLLSELQKWRASLPSTFIASARTRYSNHGSKEGDFEQIWYDIPLCAATMQSYHMASILLLVNQPQESTAIRSTVSARLKSYRHIQTEVLRHAREVCGISLANPTDPVRINSVQALFVAGQVFYEPLEQNAVLGLLSEIERDLGWTTSYHTAKLMDQWTRDQTSHPGENGFRVNWLLP
ncbi:hypothetical protein BGZ63DRAFT_425007 [Mariannaea sp. PMI_226]|nr:hypothetical protein BGZ63DRAFT_425007 [Mariannaea sp. PMI_226]